MVFLLKSRKNSKKEFREFKKAVECGSISKEDLVTYSKFGLLEFEEVDDVLSRMPLQGYIGGPEIKPGNILRKGEIDGFETTGFGYKGLVLNRVQRTG